MFENFGIYGYNNIEEFILAPLITTDPIILVGAPGTAKTKLMYLLGQIVSKVYERISEKFLGKKVTYNYRVLNVATSNPDDWVGFVIPNKETKEMEIYPSPQSLVRTIFLALDEINRGEDGMNQNKLYSLIQERTVDGVKLPVTFIFGMMNPFREDDETDEGIRPLNRALAERFAMVVNVPSVKNMNRKDRANVIVASRKRPNPLFLKGKAGMEFDKVSDDVISMFGKFLYDANKEYEGFFEEYGDALTNFMDAFVSKFDHPVDGRRIGMIQRNIAAVWAIRKLRGNADLKTVVRDVLYVSFPDETYSQPVSKRKIDGAYSYAIRFISISDTEKVKIVEKENDPLARIFLAKKLKLNPADFTNYVSKYVNEMKNTDAYYIAMLKLFDVLKKYDGIQIATITHIGRVVAHIIESAKARKIIVVDRDESELFYDLTNNWNDPAVRFCANAALAQYMDNYSGMEIRLSELEKYYIEAKKYLAEAKKKEEDVENGEII